MSENNINKGKILRGAASLAIKQVLVAVLSLASVLVTARILGPENYGIATVSLGIFYFLTQILHMGISVYMVRQSHFSETEAVQVKAFFITSGCIVCLILWLFAPALGWWTKQPEVTAAMRWLLPGILASMIGIPSASMLERELRFAELGLIDGLSQVINYALAISCAFLGFGYLALLIGAVARFVVRAVLAHVFHPIPWSLMWNWKVVKPALDYGVKYSMSSWLLNFKQVRVSLVLSRFASIEAAGIVGISVRLVQQLSLLRKILHQMSISVMAKLRDNPDQTRRALSKGMAYQALLNCSLCALFSTVSAWLIPLLFDERWMQSAALFPLIATGILALSIFNMHSSTLYAAGHIREVAIFNFVYVGGLWFISFLLTPSFGVWGYALSEVLSVPAFYVLHRSVSKLYGSPNYWSVFWISLATVIPLYGGIFLPPAVGLILFLISYGALFILSKDVRSLPLELLNMKRKKAATS